MTICFHCWRPCAHRRLKAASKTGQNTSPQSDRDRDISKRNISLTIKDWTCCSRTEDQELKIDKMMARHKQDLGLFLSTPLSVDLVWVALYSQGFINFRCGLAGSQVDDGHKLIDCQSVSLNFRRLCQCMR